MLSQAPHLSIFQDFSWQQKLAEALVLPSVNGPTELSTSILLAAHGSIWVNVGIFFERVNIATQAPTAISLSLAAYSSTRVNVGRNFVTARQSNFGTVQGKWAH